MEVTMFSKPSVLRGYSRVIFLVLAAISFSNASPQTLDIGRYRDFEDKIAAVFNKVAQQGSADSILTGDVIRPPPRPTIFHQVPVPLTRRTTPTTTTTTTTTPTTTTTSTTTTTTTTTPPPTTTTSTTTTTTPPRPTRPPPSETRGGPPIRLSDAFGPAYPEGTWSTEKSAPRSRHLGEHATNGGWDRRDPFDADERQILGIGGDFGESPEGIPDEEISFPSSTVSSPSSTVVNSALLDYNVAEDDSRRRAFTTTEHSRSPVAAIVPHIVSIKDTVGVYWDIHVYIFGISYIAIAVYCSFFIIRFTASSRPSSLGYLLTLLVIILLWSLIRGIEIFYDAYNVHGRMSTILTCVLRDIGFPLMCAAFSALFLALLQATHIRLLSPYVQNPVTLAGIITLHLLLTVITDVIVGSNLQGDFMFLVANIVYLAWSLGLIVGYVYIFRRLHTGAQRSEEEVTQELFMHYHLDGKMFPKSLTHSTLSTAVKVTLFTALVKVGVAIIVIFGLVFLFGALNDRNPPPWSWWGYQVTFRTLELFFWGFITYLVTVPLKKFHTTRSKTSLGSPSKCSVFCMSPCGNGTWQSDPKSSNGTTTLPVHPHEVETYPPAYCTKNHSLLLSTTGNGLYHEHPCHEAVIHHGQCYSITRHHKRCPASPARRSLNGTALVKDRILQQQNSSSSSTSAPPEHFQTCAVMPGDSDSFPCCPRPSSMLFSENGVVRFRTVEDPQCMDEVLHRSLAAGRPDQIIHNLHYPVGISSSSPSHYCEPGQLQMPKVLPESNNSVYQEPIDIHAPTTPRSISSSNHIYNQILARSDSHRSQFSNCSQQQNEHFNPYQGKHNPHCQYAGTLASTFGTQTLEAVRASHRAQKAVEKHRIPPQIPATPTQPIYEPTPGCRYSSACSSESAGNSFDVDIYPISGSTRRNQSSRRRAMNEKKMMNSVDVDDPDSLSFQQQDNPGHFLPSFHQFLDHSVLGQHGAIVPGDLKGVPQNCSPSQELDDDDEHRRSLATSFSEFIKNTRSLNDLFKANNSSKNPPVSISTSQANSNLSSSQCSNKNGGSLLERFRSNGSNFSLNSAQHQSYCYSPLDCEDGASCSSSLRRSRSESRMDAGSPDSEEAACRPLLTVTIPPPPSIPPSAETAPSSVPVIRRVVRKHPAAEGSRNDGCTQTPDDDEGEEKIKDHHRHHHHHRNQPNSHSPCSTDDGSVGDDASSDEGLNRRS